MKSLYLSSLAALVALIGSTTVAGAQTLSIGSDSIAQNGTATVNLNISGLGNGTALGTFDVNVGFNSSVLGFTSASFGNQLNLEGFGTFSSITPGTGTTELFQLSLDSPSALTTSQAHSFTLASLSFSGVAKGFSALSLSVNARQLDLRRSAKWINHRGVDVFCP